MPSTSDCGGDCAAYVLGALDAHEVSTFERHLSGCTICEAEVESLRETVSILPMAAPQYPASRELRRRVIRSVRADAAPAGRLLDAHDGFPRFSAGRGTVPRYAPARGFKPGLVYGLTALVLTIAVVAAGVAASGDGSKHGPQVVQASVGSAEVIVRSHSGELIVRKLPQLSPNQTYEVWLERAGGKPQPTSYLFNTDSHGYGDVPGITGLKGYDKLLVTREPHGGSAVPTHPVVVSVHNI